METKITLQDTLKSQDTEEWIDLVFYRPAGYRWALFFRKINVRPNTVTILSIVLGMASGIMFYFTDLWLNITGMLLLVWANTLDSADGQLARMTGQYSRTGRILDGAAGDLWFFSIYAGICLQLTPAWGLWIWALGAGAGYFHSKQAAMADYLRNLHLLFVKGRNGSELDDSGELAERAGAITWRKNGIEKLFLSFYIPYTKGQEKWMPEIQKLRKTMGKYSGIDSGGGGGGRYGGDGGMAEIPAGFVDDFRRESRPMMKYTNILSFNTRVIVMFITIFAHFPWIYFVFELTIMNILLAGMLYKYGNICKRFNLRLRGDD
jgi:hypothetical protein